MQYVYKMGVMRYDDCNGKYSLAAASSLIELMISPPLPMIGPTSLPDISMRRVRLTAGVSPGISPAPPLILGIR